MTYRWINHKRIYQSLPGREMGRLFVGGNSLIHHAVHFYCDRTDPTADIHIPDYLQIPLKCQTSSWEDLTRQRCRDLEDCLTQYQDCTILWSGGIDSTYILSSVIGFLNQDLFDKITIGLSAASIWENPYFYHDQILPRFKKIQDVEHQKIKPRSLVVSGNQADKIMFPEIMLQWLYEQVGQPQDLVSCKDKLLDYLERLINNRGKSESLYEITLQSAQRADVDIFTASDFLWWLGFNFTFVGMFYSKWGVHWTQSTTLQELEQDKFYWFCDPRWQSWAMSCSGRFEHIGDDWHRQYKQPAKDIIFKIDGNRFYRDYKQKIFSGTPLELSHENLYDKSVKWILAVDTDGQKYFTDPINLEYDLNRLGIRY